MNASLARWTTVRDGHVINAGRYGILLASGAVVEGLKVFGSGQDGIALGGTSILSRSELFSNGGNGASMGSRSPVSYVIFHKNYLLGAPFRHLVGGTAVIGNFCDDGTCEPEPAPRRRRYYATEGFYSGSEAADPGVCEPGFHFANLAELIDSSSLRYDSTLGTTKDDAGTGPPFISGWARTGLGSNGAENCALWTSESGNGLSWGYDPTPPPSEAQRNGPWYRELISCASQITVWCIED